MRFRRPMEDILRGRTSLRVLAALIAHPAKGFTGRELAQEADVYPSDAASVLRTLQAHGLVRRRTVGRAHEWRLQVEHYLVPALRTLLSADHEGLARLGQVVGSHLGDRPEVVRVVLFGSVARGQDGPSSDVDLLVVVGSHNDKESIRGPIQALREEVGSTFTNPLNEVIYSAAEYNAKRGRRLIQEVERDGIVIVGDEGAAQGITQGRGSKVHGKGRRVPSGRPGRRRAA